MKKIYITTVLALIALAMNAKDFTLNGLKFTTTSSNTAAIFNRNDDEIENLIIPETVSDGTVTYTVNEIRDQAFMNCKKLKSVTLPSTMRKINNAAFWGCTDLEEVKNVPEQLEYVGRLVFYDTKFRNNATGPEGLNLFGGWVIGYIGNLDEVEKLVFPSETIGITGTISLEGSNLYNLKEVVLNEGLKTVGNDAFEGFLELESLHLPASLENIENNAFEGCTGLKSISIDEKNTHFCAENNMLFDAEKKVLLLYPRGTEPEIIVTPAVETIGQNAFISMQNVRVLKVSEGVKNIAESAIRYMGKLEEVFLPSTIEDIATGNFTWCKKIKSIVCEAVTPPTYNGEDFAYIDGGATLYVPEGSIETYKAHKDWGKLTVKPLSEFAGAEQITATATETSRYDITGRILTQPERGINIVKMSDGTVKKVIVR